MMNALIVVVAAVVAADPAARIEPSRLIKDLRDLPPSRTVSTSPDRQIVLKNTEEMLLGKLRHMGYTPVEQYLKWTTKGDARVLTNTGWTTVPDPAPKTWRNIYVEIPGKTHPNEIIIVSAHFDSVPGTPGADDDGTGVAAALELARTLKDTPMQRTVRIVLFNLEEIGLVGSTEHAAWTKQRLDAGTETIVGMMSLEMLGYFTDEPNSQRIPIPAIPGVFEPPTVGDFIAIVANQASATFARSLVCGMNDAEPTLKTTLIDFVPGVGETMPDVRRSDHAPFWDIGVPAALVTDTSEFRTPHYHKPSDTIDTLDMDRYTKTCRAIAGAVWRLAGPIESND